METNWAEDHLQTIRTLMERSAVYRRALAPIMTYVGVVGTAAATLGWMLKIFTPRAFILYWAITAVLALGGSFLLVRRQALKDAEPFWSPPTRRVSQALWPPLAAGLMISSAIFINVDSALPNIGSTLAIMWLPRIWIMLYGCALYSAGFFMPRGMKVFGLIVIAGGCGTCVAGIQEYGPTGDLGMAYGNMAFFFGVLHLAYGGYLYFTEKRKNAS